MAKPNQNQIDKQFTTTQLSDFDAALTTLEGLLDDIEIPTPEEKTRLARPPEGAGNWETKMRTLANQNLDKLPGSLSSASIQSDVDLVSQLSARKVRLKAIADRMDAGIFKGNSDVFTACLNIRKGLIDGGAPDVDHDLDEGMSSYFQREKKTPPPAKP